jgi:replicative DNA helicase
MKPKAKLMPHAIDIEEAVLGAILLDKDAILEVIDIVSEDSFYKTEHKKIYKSILELNNNSETIDIITVAQRLKKNGDLERVGGAFGITQITDRVASSANIESHARILKQKEISRSLIKLGSEILESAYDETVDVFDITEHLLTEAYNIDSDDKSSKEESNSELLIQLKRNIEQANLKSGISGLTTGIHKIDALYGGYQNGHLIIKAGRPAMGKSAQALCEASHMALHEGKSVLLFSLEMTSLELMRRLIAINTEIPLTRMQEGNMTDDDWKVYNEVASRIMDSKLKIIDTPGMTLNGIRKISKKHAMKYGLDAMFIDYLQLINHFVKGGSREQEVSIISKSLKQLAKELDIPVVALCQLSRAVEQRGGAKKPILSDLRESGSIEQDADSVQFLYRPEYYGITEDEDGNSVVGKGFMLIAKNRHGATKDIEMKFIGSLTKFDNWSDNQSFIPQEEYNPNAGMETNNDFDSAPF